MTQITNPFHDRIIVGQKNAEYQAAATAYRTARGLRPVRRRAAPRALMGAAALLSAVTLGFVAGRADASSSTAADCSNGLGSYEIGCDVPVPGRADGWFVPTQSETPAVEIPVDLSRVR